MVERDRSDLSVVRQCRLLSISRSSFYATPRGESDENLAIMAEIDRQFLDTPFYGVRQMTWHLRAKDWPVNVKRVRRLMRKMGLMPIYQRPRTSTPAPGHKIYPYLLRGLTIDRPNQVWCTDLTYIPLARGFCISSPSWTGGAARSWLGACRTPWKPSSASTLSRRHWIAMASPRSSTATRAANSPRPSSLRR